MWGWGALLFIKSTNFGSQSELDVLWAILYDEESKPYSNPVGGKKSWCCSGKPGHGSEHAGHISGGPGHGWGRTEHLLGRAWHLIWANQGGHGWNMIGSPRPPSNISWQMYCQPDNRTAPVGYISDSKFFSQSKFLTRHSYLNFLHYWDLSEIVQSKNNALTTIKNDNVQVDKFG